MKLLIWLVVGLAVLVWLQRLIKKVTTGGPHPGSTPSARESLSGGRPPVEQMVCCAVCGLHVPHSESLVDNAGNIYCSPEHRQQARR